MSRRDEKRPDSRPRPNHGPDGLPAVMKTGPAAATASRFAEITDEPGLGASDRRETEEHADMGGQPQTPRMGDSLSVDEKEIGLSAECGKNIQNDGPFPE